MRNPSQAIIFLKPVLRKRQILKNAVCVSHADEFF